MYFAERLLLEAVYRHGKRQVLEDERKEERLKRRKAKSLDDDESAITLSDLVSILASGFVSATLAWVLLTVSGVYGLLLILFRMILQRRM